MVHGSNKQNSVISESLTMSTIASNSWSQSTDRENEHVAGSKYTLLGVISYLPFCSMQPPAIKDT